MIYHWFLPQNRTLGRKADPGPTLVAAGGALVPAGGVLWVGSCAVVAVLSADGSYALSWTT